MIGIIYRSYIKKDYQEKYQNAWEIIADYFVQERGAIGSCLHKIDEGHFLAYSRWPNRKVREKSKVMYLINDKSIPEKVRLAIKIIKDSKDNNKEQFDEIVMDLINDKLVSN
jgi:hypothetical protein